METVFNHVISFPTVIFSVPLTICLIFWFISLLGLTDIEVVELDLDAEGGEGLAGLLATFGLTGVPITLSTSLLFFFAWGLCLMGATWLLPLIPGQWIMIGVGLALILLSFTLAVFITGRITRPLSRVFVVHEARSNNSLPGQQCTITSMKVTADFGQAKVEDGGAGLIISVRCETGDTFNKGDQALIYQYDSDKNIYHIAKLT